MFNTGAYKVRLSKQARPIVEHAFATQCHTKVEFEAKMAKLQLTLKSFLNQGRLPPDSVVATQLHPILGAVYVAPLWGVQVAICVDDMNFEIHVVGAV